jgi:hypothetical protein
MNFTVLMRKDRLIYPTVVKPIVLREEVRSQPAL